MMWIWTYRLQFLPRRHVLDHVDRTTHELNHYRLFPIYLDQVGIGDLSEVNNPLKASAGTKRTLPIVQQS